MPLLDYGSEFATKWSTLYDAQIEEGIHTPIKAYEFLNKYYVIEGNKRTSCTQICRFSNYRCGSDS